MRYENGLDQVVLEQWDERQIAHFEEIGERLIGNLEEKKKDIKKQIARENLREIERKAHYELEGG
ncbi:hypothetical protein ACUC2M_03280 [Bacillus cytotoxicus]